MTAHELARALLAGPDLEVGCYASHCGCGMPERGAELRVVVEVAEVLITDDARIGVE